MSYQKGLIDLYSTQLYSNLNILIKFVGIIIFSIGLYIVAQKWVDKGQVKGRKHFERAVKLLRAKKISQEEFDKRIEERI